MRLPAGVRDQPRPLFIGNHFEQWNGGIYMDAVEEAIKHIGDEKHKDVRMVSFRQLCDWLDAQDPQVLADLRRAGCRAAVHRARLTAPGAGRGRDPERRGPGTGWRTGSSPTRGAVGGGAGILTGSADVRGFGVPRDPAWHPRDPARNPCDPIWNPCGARVEFGHRRSR